MRATKIIRMPARGFPPEREQDVTASMVGALCGSGRFVSLWELWRHKKYGDPLPKVAKIARKGARWEDFIAEELAEKYDLRIRKARVYLRDPELQLGATPDYWLYEKKKGLGVLEVKRVHWTAWRDHWGEGMSPPLDYLLQHQVQMGLAGASWGLIGCEVAGEQLYVFPIPFRPGTYDQIKREVMTFWQSVYAGNEPPVDARAEADAVLRVFKEITPGHDIDLTGNNEAGAAVEAWLEADQRLASLRADVRTQEEARKAAQATLIGIMRTAETAKVGSHVIITKTAQRKGHPVPPSVVRNFTIKEV